jgi:hypothetical protein
LSAITIPQVKHLIGIIISIYLVYYSYIILNLIQFFIKS